MFQIKVNASGAIWQQLLEIELENNAEKDIKIILSFYLTRLMETMRRSIYY
jgi:hypothetical protein